MTFNPIGSYFGGRKNTVINTIQRCAEAAPPTTASLLRDSAYLTGHRARSDGA